MLAVLFWGISFVSTKIVLTGIAPVSIALFRQFIALVPLVVLMFIRKESFRPARGDWLMFAVASLFGIVLYFICENNGLTMTTASSASMLVAAIPIFILVMESLINKKRLGISSLACIIASFLGVYFIIFEKGSVDLSGKTFLGNLLVLGAMASWIIYTFLGKNLGERYSSLKMTTVQSFLSIPLFLPFTISEMPAWHVPSFDVIANLVFLGVFCSGFAYVFYLYGIQALGPVLPSAFLNLIPVVTIITGMIVLSETLTLIQAIGAFLIVGSLTLLSLMKLREKSRHSKGALEPKIPESGEILHKPDAYDAAGAERPGNPTKPSAPPGMNESEVVE